MTQTPTPGFMVLHGNRLEDLRNLLVSFLKSHPLPPLSPEVLLVQSNGMKHWLEMGLADDSALGICAATRLELPSSYMWQVYRNVLGVDAVPQQMPFDKSVLIWRLMRLLPELAMHNAVYAPLKRYLDGDADGRKIYQLSMQVADVLDGYQNYRADWLADWTLGKDVLRAYDGSTPPMGESHIWQAQLWRDIQADVGDTLAQSSRASTHDRFIQAMKQLTDNFAASKQRPAGLPPRIVVFGISSLPMQTVQALAALGQVCQVLMFVQNPCQHYWGDIVEGHDQLRKQVLRRQQQKPVKSAPAAADLSQSPTHPLLASWGKQARDYLHLLDDFDSVESYRKLLTRVDVFVDPVADDGNLSLLAQVQSAILNLDPVPDSPKSIPDDQSITLIMTHSAQREIEVLHDRLLAWFDADATLQPRDVMVMVPDMESFAPYIQAVFGRFATGQPRHIPFSVTDMSHRQSPIVQALETLLSLPGSRLSLADWLGLFEVAAVRNRFGLTEADVEQLHTWLLSAGVRWGLDGEHRRAWGFPEQMTEGVAGVDQNTWAFGLRRLLLGYAVGQGEPWCNTLPLAAVGGLDASLISHLLEWVEAANLTLNELSQELTADEWVQTLTGIVDRFFLATDDAEERLLQGLVEPLDKWKQACDDARLVNSLPLVVVREHWLEQIQEPGLRQRFFGGGVQFATLMPMRSIPFKAVCLLGMNDGDYPRQVAPRDFDLMAQSWRAGDRSRREDDRFMFLEALLSARQKLYISWQGRRASDNALQPPSVLVAQLIDYLKASWTPAPVPALQPLQPFSGQYFQEGSGFSTYADDWAQVHAKPGKNSTNDDSKVDVQDRSINVLPTALTLGDLRQLVRQPVDVFFRGRLHVWLDSVDEAEQEVEPFSLDNLEQYHVGQDLLAAENETHALQNLKLSGTLPMAAFGEHLAQQLNEKVAVVRERRQHWKEQYPFELPTQSVTLTLNGVSEEATSTDELTVSGTLTGLWCNRDDDKPKGWLQLACRSGAVLQGKEGEKVARAHIVAGLWVNHLAACAGGANLTSVQLGVDGGIVFDPLPSSDAKKILQRLAQSYMAAWVRPLPVACKTAWAFLQTQIKVENASSEKPSNLVPIEEAQKVFEDGFKFAGEWTESLYLSRAFEGFGDIEEELPAWAEALYGDMAQQAKLSSEVGAQT